MEWDAAVQEFHDRFQTEAMCIDHLVQMKWPNGYSCERCGCRSAYRTETRRLPLFECADCRYQASPIVGTVMEEQLHFLAEMVFGFLFDLSRAP
jgi:hypothetical protein